MKWRYAWRELWHHPLMMLLIFVQNVVVFAVTVSMISTIVSRYNTYQEISDLVSGNGAVYTLQGYLSERGWRMVFPICLQERRR